MWAFPNIPKYTLLDHNTSILAEDAIYCYTPSHLKSYQPHKITNNNKNHLVNL